MIISNVLGNSSSLHINSNDIVEHTEDYIISNFSTKKSIVHNDSINVYTEDYQIKTFKKNRSSHLGILLVGWGGNNGSTLTASLMAHKLNLQWKTRRGIQKPNFYGSLLLASTVHIGQSSYDGSDVYLPWNKLVPLNAPEDIVLGGWDISSKNMYQSVKRAQVLEPDLVGQLKPHLESIVPLPSIYYPEFIAKNQRDRADNLLPGDDKAHHLDLIRGQIRKFRKDNNLESVIVLWTANTESYMKYDLEKHGTVQTLLDSISKSDPSISPSCLFAVASILEGCPFINGSPQNTLLIPAIQELAYRENVPIGGDDLKSGQTKLKSVLVDFLIGSGIKPLSIVSYNHLGNNDGKNLAEKPQFYSKELSKKNVVDDMVNSNCILYNHKLQENPNHTIIIEYVPAVGDSKRAMDEYECEIFMGGRQTIAIHNICEDSLLAVPLILDLVLLMEFLGRVKVRRMKNQFCPSPSNGNEEEWESLHTIYSLLAFMLKAPLVPSHAPTINALMTQRRAIETLFKACIGLPSRDDLCLEHRLREKEKR